MDVLSAVLMDVGVAGSVFCYGPVSGCWGMRGGAEGQVLFHALVDGVAWARVGDGPPLRMEAGEVMVLPRGGVHVLGATRDVAPVPLGAAVARDPGAPFARLAMEGEGHDAWLICGALSLEGEATHPLLATLPEVLVARTHAARWLADTVRALARQLASDAPGSALTAARLSEVLFVQSLGAWLAEADDDVGWGAAVRDPPVAQALSLMHGQPEAAWTASSLARAVGVSRTVLFDRFSSRLGEPPMRWLTRVRMHRAATRLARTDDAMITVAEAVGYGSVPAFSKAFRRHHGHSPGKWRAAQRARG